MKQDNELCYYEEVKDWDFSEFQIESEALTNWDLYELLNEVATSNSKILDLGTGGGEKVIKYFPDCKEILGTDFSKAMIETANKNLRQSGRKNIEFKLMNNLEMTVDDCYYDIVVARNTVTDPQQIYKCLKEGGYLFIHGVDMYDCHSLKLLFCKGQAFNDKKPISIIDYENIISAGFKDVELVPIHKREYFKNKKLFMEFLKKVPIIDDFNEEENNNKSFINNNLDENLIDLYINDNTYDGKIRLLRRYYGITARK